MCAIPHQWMLASEFKRNVLFGMFLLLFTVWAFPYSSYCFVTKDDHRNIFTFSANWKSAMKNPLSSFGSSLTNGTQYLQYKGKQCLNSFPRLTRFACCENGVFVSFAKSANTLFFSLHSRYIFFVQVYCCTRYWLQKLLQKFCGHTHFLIAATLLELCKALHLHFFLKALLA